MQNGKLGAENLGKIFSEVSEISENSEFSRPHPVEAAYRVFLVLLALLNSKVLNQGTVSAVASMSKTHRSMANLLLAVQTQFTQQIQ